MGSVAALTVAFNEERMICPNVRQFKEPYLEKNIYHLILISEKPWRGDHWSDRTYEFAKAEGADNVFIGPWKGQAEQFNWGLKFLNLLGYEWAIICDADEFYSPKQIKYLLSKIEWTNSDAIKTSRMNVYWREPIYRIFPEQGDCPVIAIRTNQTFLDKRSTTASFDVTDVVMDHFSYVRNNHEMLKKIESFEHSHEFDVRKWYNEVWMKWPQRRTNLHPVIPYVFGGVNVSPPDEKIMENFYADQGYKNSTK